MWQKDKDTINITYDSQGNCRQTTVELSNAIATHVLEAEL